DAIHFIGTARRQISLAPQCLEEAYGGVVIFRLGISRLDHRFAASRPEILRQSLSHQQENAITFVEHSFNMTGQCAGNRANCHAAGDGSCQSEALNGIVPACVRSLPVSESE